MTAAIPGGPFLSQSYWGSVLHLSNCPMSRPETTTILPSQRLGLLDLDAALLSGCGFYSRLVAMLTCCANRAGLLTWAPKTPEASRGPGPVVVARLLCRAAGCVQVDLSAATEAERLLGP